MKFTVNIKPIHIGLSIILIVAIIAFYNKSKMEGFFATFTDAQLSALKKLAFIDLLKWRSKTITTGPEVLPKDIKDIVDNYPLYAIPYASVATVNDAYENAAAPTGQKLKDWGATLFRNVDWYAMYKVNNVTNSLSTMLNNDPLIKTYGEVYYYYLKAKTDYLNKIGSSAWK